MATASHLQKAALVWLVATAAAAAPHAFGSKPHLVFILQDDLGHFDVAFSGNKAAALITANITKLASEGVILNSHYVHWHCSPTRRSFLSGRLPVHHHEQLSDDASDDLDLRYTWISGKLKQAGYQNFWFGKGHTGYKSMAHLPTRNGFDRFVGFLSGSQSYTSTDRWEGEHPLNTDAEFTDPPPTCVPGAVPDLVETGAAAQLARATGPGAVCARALELACNAERTNHSMCLSCAANHKNETTKADCTNAEIERFCSETPPRPHPQPPQRNDTKCHADTYSTTLYGELCLAAIAAHDVAKPFFLYFPIQAVHGPYDAVPFNPTDDTYMGMLWDSDVYVGAIVNLLKKKAMYENTLLVYSADNGAGGGPPHLAPGTGTGLNWPLRGEKHTNWDGGLKAAAFISGGLVPAQLRGTSSDVNCHVVDWYPTFSYLAGVTGTDDPVVKPLPIDPADPTKDIYMNFSSFPAVDGVNLWPWLIENPGAANRSSAHAALVLTKEVVVVGKYKLLVAQNFGWSHTSDNGWKQPGNGTDPWKGGEWITPTKPFPCGSTDGPGHLATLPGIPGQLPCLFDLDADETEHTDLGADPENLDLVNSMWDTLNRTVLTAFCKNVSRTGGCNSSPAKLLGPCNATCAKAYWNVQGHVDKDSSGPICGVPGCQGGEVAAVAAVAMAVAGSPLSTTAISRQPHSVRGDPPLPTLSPNGRSAVIAEGTSPIPVGLYTMIFASYPTVTPPGAQDASCGRLSSHGRSQSPPMAPADWAELAGNGYITAVSLHFSWSDIQPDPPPAPLSFHRLTAALNAIDAGCAANGRPKGCLPVFLKPYFAREPKWSYTGPEVRLPTIATNALGMKVVVRPSDVNGTDLWNKYNWLGGVSANKAIPISTDPVWRRHVAKLTQAVGNWLGSVDPNATRVPVLHFAGPVMDSLQMRPGPDQLFAFLSDDGGVDTLGMNWTKPGHIGAWEAMAHGMADAAKENPALGKRAWVFDFAGLPPNHKNQSLISMGTADQARVFDALARSHPRGPWAVIAKSESLHVDLAAHCTHCGYKPGPLHAPLSFASQYLNSAIPYGFIGGRRFRHGWENFAGLAMKGTSVQPTSRSSVPAMYPIPRLANFSMFADLNRTAPVSPQGTLWAEVWRFEGVNTSTAPACDTPAALVDHLRRWDADLKINYKRAVDAAAEVGYY